MRALNIEHCPIRIPSFALDFRPVSTIIVHVTDMDVKTTEATAQAAAKDRDHKEREHFFGSAKLIAGLTVLSRIAGMGRQMAMALFGANTMTDAFNMAFQIPNLFRRLFAEGALSAAFVPIFTETLQSDESGLEKARKLLANAMGLLTLLMVSIMVLIQIGLLVWAFWPSITGASPHPPDRQLMIQLTSIMMPFMVTICMLGLASAALNCRGHFAYPAATPIILNLVIIVANVYIYYAWRGTSPDSLLPKQLTIVAISVTVAGVVQLLGVYWLLKRTGFPLGMMLRPLQPGIGPLVRTMGPMILGLGFLQLSQLLSSVLATALAADEHSATLHLFGWSMPKPLVAGALTQLTCANTLYQFPMGVMAISLGVAVFPLLTRYAMRGDTANFRDSLNRAMRISFMEGMASGVGMYILAEPITLMIYRLGRYTMADIHTTAFILQMYALGMWAYCTYQIILRAFYAVKDTKTPLKLSCVLAPVSLLMVCGLVWIKGLNVGAFGVATAVTFAINTLVLGYLLRRRLGQLGARKMAASFARTLIACAIMAGALYGLLAILANYGVTGQTRSQCGLIVAVTVPAGAMVFILAAWLMRAPELAELAGPIVQRLRKKNVE